MAFVWPLYFNNIVTYISSIFHFKWMLQVLFAAWIGSNLLYWLPFCMQKLMSIIPALLQLYTEWLPVTGVWKQLEI
jgi:hypothetical protein